MQILTYFKALSDITRIRIYNILIRYELSVNEIVSVLEMGQSRVSRHLKIMSDAGLLDGRRNGVKIFYSAGKNDGNHLFTESVKHLLESEEGLAVDLERALRIVNERKQKTRNFFNKNAQKWDLLKREVLGGFDLYAQLAVEAEGAGLAVDLGCGTGELLSRIAGVARKTIGVDSSPRMLEEAQKRFTGEDPHVELRLGELEHLPVGNDEADTAMICLALHHLNKPDAAIGEAFRILKPRGKLVIAEFDKHENESLANKFGDIWLGFGQKEISRWLGNNGFNLVHTSAHEIQNGLTVLFYTSFKQ